MMEGQLTLTMILVWKVYWNTGNKLMEISGKCGTVPGVDQRTFADITISKNFTSSISTLEGQLTLIFILLCYGSGRIVGTMEVEL